MWAYLFFLLPVPGAWLLDALLAWIYSGPDALEEVPS